MGRTVEFGNIGVMHDARALHYLLQLRERVQFTPLHPAQQFHELGGNLIGRGSLHPLAVDSPQDTLDPLA